MCCLERVLTRSCLMSNLAWTLKVTVFRLSLHPSGVDVSKYELDHMCFRVATTEEYNDFMEKLATFGVLLSEVKIGGRKVATFKLNNPHKWKGNSFYATSQFVLGREIPCVELPQPKEKSPYPRGLEHVEFVIDKSFDDFMASYPSLTFDLSGSKKHSNPDIQLKFKGERNVSVKFHHSPLEEVIKREKEAGVEEVF